METLGKLENYIAFYLACPPTETLYCMKTVEKYLDDSHKFLCCQETSKHSHKDTSGNHIHFLCSMTEKAYKAYIQEIKKP